MTAAQMALDIQRMADAEYNDARGHAYARRHALRNIAEGAAHVLHTSSAWMNARDESERKKMLQSAAFGVYSALIYDG